MIRTKDLQKYVIQEFASDITQEYYKKKAQEGLWGAEKILADRYFAPKSKILDIGCGTGRTTVQLFREGYDVLGIDITPTMIANAQEIAKSKKLNIRYAVGDATHMVFKDGSFDNALFSNNGWTQIPGKDKRMNAMRDIYRILKPGGHYIFTTHLRKMKGYTLFWINQWIRFNILRKLGMQIDEEDFGDRFFDRESSGTQFSQKQYIHVPSLTEVKKCIRESGFTLIYNSYGNEIDGTKGYQPMYYVCKK